MKRYELERRLRLKNSMFEPSLRYELLSMIPPNVRHPSHSIGQIVNCFSFIHSVAIRKDVFFFCCPTTLVSHPHVLYNVKEITNLVICIVMSNNLNLKINETLISLIKFVLFFFLILVQVTSVM